jgi:hypothetical protein
LEPFVLAVLELCDLGASVFHEKKNTEAGRTRRGSGARGEAFHFKNQQSEIINQLMPFDELLLLFSGLSGSPWCITAAR